MSANRLTSANRQCAAPRLGIAALVFFLLMQVPLLTRGHEVSEPADYWTGPINSPVPATIAGGQTIDAKSLARFLESNPDAVLIDVSNAPRRPEGMPADAPWLPLPQPAIMGAEWIPGAGMGEIAADVDAFFRDYLAQATHRDFTHPVVIYCHEHCWLSWNAARRAISYGYERVYWFPEGIEGWRAAGYKTTTVKPRTP